MKFIFGPLEYIMDIVHITTKGKMMDTLERYHIYRETYIQQPNQPQTNSQIQRNIRNRNS